MISLSGFVLDVLRYVVPVKLGVYQLRQAAVKLPGVTAALRRFQHSF